LVIVLAKITLVFVQKSKMAAAPSWTLFLLYIIVNPYVGL